MKSTLRLPVLPLRQLVVFPGATVPILAGREKTLAALEAAVAAAGDEAPELVALAQHGDQPDPAPERLHRVGTRVRIVQAQAAGAGQQLLCLGIERLRVVELHDGAHLEAEVVPLDDLPLVDREDPAFLGLHREVRARARELLVAKGVPAKTIDLLLGQHPEPGALADVVAYHLEAPVARKQALLENPDVEERLRQVLILLSVELGVEAAQQKIRQAVQDEIGDRQQQAFLREQLKAIRRQLGEEDGASRVEELRARLADLPLPEEGRAEVERALGRLERLPPEASESQVLWSWLEAVGDLPWATRSAETVDVAEARKVLDAEHLGLEDVKARVLEFLAVRQLRQRRPRSDTAGAPGTPARGPILLFLGPPGTGKTSVAESIAHALGREYVRISLGGARDEADIRGHRRTYVGAMPGRILQGMRRAGTRNPVVCLDEVDKMGASFQGDPGAALLEVLDPAQNHSFVDHYLGIPFDLSEVLFVCTANVAQGIPGPLADRMETIEFAGYTEREKLAIARRFLLPRHLEAAGIDPGDLEIPDASLAQVIASWTREAGLRQLDRVLGTLVRKTALALAEGRAAPLVVEPGQLRATLGSPRARPERRLERSEVGVATGLYYTPAGGDVMFVETAVFPGRGELILTGHLGDVMKESARAAWSFARSRASRLGIHEASLGERDLHVHVPAGAIPKDGPSAGVTMATAVVSALSGRPVRADLAMTGELSLRGRVMPIGGVKEKVLGAARAGIREVILPAANREDLEDLPEEVRGDLRFHLVEDLDQLLALALEPAPATSLRAVE